MAVGQGDRLGTRTGAEFGQDALHVAGHRVGGDEQLDGDFRVGMAFREYAQNLQLAAGQPEVRAGRLLLFVQPRAYGEIIDPRQQRRGPQVDGYRSRLAQPQAGA